MTLLTRYIAAIYLKMFGLALGSFVSLYLVIDILEKLARYLKYQPKPLHLLAYFACKVPGIINEVIPMAILMATLLSLNMLSRTSELTAMRSVGISLRTISAPILVIAFLASISSVLLGELVVPTSYKKMQYIDDFLIHKKDSAAFFRQNNIWFRDENLILSARVFNPAQQVLRGVTIWEVGEGMTPLKRLEADQASWNGNSWRLNGVTTRELQKGTVTKTAKSVSQPISLNLKISDLIVVNKSADNMGFFKLRKYVNKLRKGGYDPTRYEALMHSRISYPFASLVMAFVGIPFSLRGGRSRGIALGIGASIGIGFAYFIIHSALESFGQTGVLPPLVSAWAANVIFALSGVWLAMTMDH